MREKVFHSPMIRAQSFGDLVLLDCDLHKCVPGFFLRMARVAGLGFFPSLGHLGSDKTLAG